jgi:hypothetical protein
MLLFAWKQHGLRKKKGGMEKGRKKSGISSIGEHRENKNKDQDAHRIHRCGLHAPC